MASRSQSSVGTTVELRTVFDHKEDVRIDQNDPETEEREDDDEEEEEDINTDQNGPETEKERIGDDDASAADDDKEDVSTDQNDPDDDPGPEEQRDDAVKHVVHRSSVDIQ